MARKTIEVTRIKGRVNVALANHDVNTPEYRQGVAAVLEDVLHETGNYRGFQFTDPKREHDGSGYLIDGTYDPTIRAYY